MQTKIKIIMMMLGILAGQVQASEEKPIKCITLTDMAFLAACKRGDLTNAQGLLAAGANINAVGPKNYTALQWAATKGHKDVAELLFSKGADHKGVLLGAACGGHRDMVDLVLRHDTVINKVTESDNEALVWAVASASDEMIEMIEEHFKQKESRGSRHSG